MACIWSLSLALVVLLLVAVSVLEAVLLVAASVLELAVGVAVLCSSQLYRW